MMMSEMIIDKKTGVKLRDLQLKSLEILLYFKDFCKDHNLTFYLCGGSCIGAIRHEGFIPWDDDIDVFMLRDDYEKLKSLWLRFANNEKYSYCRTNEKINLKHSVASIRDNTTTYIRDYQQNMDINQGVRLDIIPIDGCPNSKIKRKIQIGWAFIFHLFNREVTEMSNSKVIGLLAKMLLIIIKKRKLRYKIWTYAEKQMSKYSINKDTKYVTELCVPYRYIKNDYPADIFKKQLWVKFEDYKMPIPLGYNEYLTMAFGDYNILPPEHERTPKHDAVYINLDEGYKKFKGINYCIEKI